MPPRQIKNTSAARKTLRAGEGNSAFNPANIPLEQTKQENPSKERKIATALFGKERITPCHPPIRAPRKRKYRIKKKKTRAERRASGKKPCTPKKRTSSLPDKNPAPTILPSRVNTQVRVFFIPLYIRKEKREYERINSLKKVNFRQKECEFPDGNKVYLPREVKKL